MKIADMVDDPNFNPASNKDRGDWSLRDVTSKEVYLDPIIEKPRCAFHGAMNCVSSSRVIWRCLACGRSCIDVDSLS